MTAKELTSKALRDEVLPRSPKGGRTPSQTMKSKLSVHIRTFGDASPFVRSGPGKFFLRELLEPGASPYPAPPFRPAHARERVFAFPQSVLDELGRFQGIEVDWRRYYAGIAEGAACGEIDRMTAEADDSIKQVLTYVLVHRGDGAVLSYERGSINRADESLRGLTCIGFGGHVSSSDASLFGPDDIGLFTNAARELTEEITFQDEGEARSLLSDPSGRLRIIGVINDDSSSNGRRHFAFVMAYSIHDERDWISPKGREKSINRVRWLDVGVAPSLHIHNFEYWSQLCLRTFNPELARATPSFKIRRKSAFRIDAALCLAGQMGSGKTEAASLLKAEFGYSEVNSGRVLAGLLNIPPVPLTPRAEFQAFAEEFIETPAGPSLLGEAIAEEVKSAGHKTLVDGIRHRSTLNAFRDALHPQRVGLVYVQTPVDIAYELYRAREDTRVSMGEFVALRGAPVETHVEELLDIADAAIFNWVGLDDYQETLRSFIAEICGSG